MSEERCSDIERDARYGALCLEAAALRLTLAHPQLVGSRTEVTEQLARAQAAVAALRAETDLSDGRLGLDGDLARDALWLIVAPCLDERFRDLIARANDNLLRHFVDGALCQRVLGGSDPARRREVLALVRPGGELHRRGLITFARVDAHPNPLHFELVPHADVVGALSGARVLSVPLALGSAHAALAVTRRAALARSRPMRRPELAGALDAMVADWQRDGEPGVCVILAGRPGSGRATHVLEAAARRGLAVLEAQMGALSPHDRDAAEALEALCRESALHGEVVLLRDAGAALGIGMPWAPRLKASLSRWSALVVCCVEENDRVDPGLMGAVRLRLRLDLPNAPEARGALLDEALGAARVAHLRDVDRHRLGALSPLQVQHVARLLEAFERQGGPDGEREHDGPDASDASLIGLEAAFHSQLLADTGGLAAVSQPVLRLDELVLPDQTLDQVAQVIAAVRNRSEVLHGWGLARRIRRGIGICCLFDGEPGTGKTLAAEVVAGELGLQLLRIDVSNIVDKYVGETEKHLARIFEKAQPETSILLFDEADALFSKRTEVKSSHDHYANMSINVLLQLIEAYEGVTVLTTNLKQSIDPAFERRIMFKIPFPMPEAQERMRLWEHLLPPGIPTEEALDFEALSEVEMSGGSIKNAILRAAYACAHDDRLLSTDALLEAGWREAAASGRLVRQDVDFEM